MSGFVVMWNLNGETADRRLLERLTATIAHRGPEGASYCNGPVGFGHRMSPAAPGSLPAALPLRDLRGDLCLAWDGRLDNREDLLGLLGAEGVHLRRAGDAELVLKAYHAWGRDCPSRLLGDFAFVLHDGSKQALLAVRDPIGCKPLYYYADDRLLLCASDLPPLLAHPAYRRRCNEGMLGEYLACEITSQEDTLYEGIRRLPPAHVLLVQPGRLTTRRYWEADPLRALACRSDEDYVEHFQALLEEAVRCRLRSPGPVGVHLSGGLDSSSVAATAQDLHRRGRAGCAGIEAFSLVFPDLPCDESAFIDEVARQWRMPSHRVTPAVQGPAYFADLARQDQDFPGYPNGTMADSLRTLARDKGIRILLTGSGGDEWLTGSLDHAADLLRGLKLRPMLNRIGFEAGNSAVRDILRAALVHGLRPLLPLGWRRTLKGWLRRDGVPAWIDPQFARRINLADRLTAIPPVPRFPSLAQDEIYATLQSGWWPHSLEMEERAAARCGVEESHPLCDRRLIEFALALPEDQRWRGAEFKFILRQSMRDRLPASVRQRLDKAEFSPVVRRSLEAAGGGRLFETAAAAGMGMIRSSVLQRMYQEQDKGAAHLWPLWSVAGVEIWLRTVWAEPDCPVSGPTGLVKRTQPAWQ